MSAREAALGVVATACAAAVLPVLLGHGRAAPDLEVRFREKGRYVLLSDDRASASVEVSSSRADVAHERTLLHGPGLGFETWRATFGERWEREVTLPFLVGPFDREDAHDWPCSVALRLRPELFSGPLAAFVRAKIEERFPIVIEGLTFPKVVRDDVSFDLRCQGQSACHTLVARADVGLADGTRLQLSVPVNLRGARDEMLMSVKPARLVWTGPTRDAAAATIGRHLGRRIGGEIGGDIGGDIGGEIGAVLGDFVPKARVDQEAEARVSALLRAAMSQLRVTLPVFPFTRRGDGLMPSFCDAPEVAADGVTLRLRARTLGRSSSVDGNVPGPIHLDAPPVVTRSPAGKNLDVVLSPAALDEAFYLLWQTGELRALSNDHALASQLQAVRIADDVVAGDLLPFALEEVIPGLPPVVDVDRSASESLRVVLADVELGEHEGAAVVAHADLQCGIAVQDRAVTLTAKVEGIRASCVRPSPGVRTLLPCFSDALPVLREQLERHPVTFTWRSTELLSDYRYFKLGGQRVGLEDLEVSACEKGALCASARLDLEVQ